MPETVSTPNGSGWRPNPRLVRWPNAICAPSAVWNPAMRWKRWDFTAVFATAEPSSICRPWRRRFARAYKWRVRPDARLAPMPRKDFGSRVPIASRKFRVLLDPATCLPGRRRMFCSFTPLWGNPEPLLKRCRCERDIWICAIRNVAFSDVRRKRHFGLSPRNVPKCLAKSMPHSM